MSSNFFLISKIQPRSAATVSSGNSVSSSTMAPAAGMTQPGTPSGIINPPNSPNANREQGIKPLVDLTEAKDNDQDIQKAIKLSLQVCFSFYYVT